MAVMEDNTDISTSGPVSAQDFRFSQQFTEYTEKQLDRMEPSLNRRDLRDIFLRIYGNPVLSKEKLALEKENKPI